MIKTTKLSLLASLAMVSVSFSASANLWREVEIIVFQQLKGQDKLRESFPEDIVPVSIRGTGDFISPLIQPNIKALRDSLSVCFEDPTLKAPETLYPLPQAVRLLADDDELLTKTLEFPRNDFFAAFDLDEESSEDEIADFDSDFITQARTYIDLDVEDEHQAFQVQKDISCTFSYEQNYLSSEQLAQTQMIAERVPRQLFAPQVGDSLSYVLPKSSARLNEVVTNIHRSRGMRLMLHTVWRQNIEYGRKARSYRLFAGQNYSVQFAYDGLPVSLLNPEADLDMVKDKGQNAQLTEPSNQQQSHQVFVDGLLAAIDSAGPDIFQQQDNPENLVELPSPVAGQPEQTWQLDGKFRLYLKSVNRVPYMFLDWDLNYRQPGKLPEKYQPLLSNSTEAIANGAGLTFESEQLDVLAEDYLYAFPFKQTRRLISNEVHYFDHPYFGVILQIRRFTPDPED